MNLFVVPNLGLLFYIFVGHFILALIAWQLQCCSKRFPRVVGTIEKKSNSYLYWNGTMRFLVEGYLDMALFSLMNLAVLDWDTNITGIKVCNYVTIFILALTCSLPIFMLFFYLFKSREWNSEAFKAKYGTVLDELRDNGNWTIVILPVGNLVRRAAFCMLLVYW